MQGSVHAAVHPAVGLLIAAQAERIQPQWPVHGVFIDGAQSPILPGRAWPMRGRQSPAAAATHCAHCCAHHAARALQRLLAQAFAACPFRGSAARSSHGAPACWRGRSARFPAARCPLPGDTETPGNNNNNNNARPGKRLIGAPGGGAKRTAPSGRSKVSPCQCMLVSAALSSAANAECGRGFGQRQPLPADFHRRTG